MSDKKLTYKELEKRLARAERKNVRLKNAVNKQPEDIEISEIRYRRLFETAQDGILIIDARTETITDVNPFLIEMLGYPRTDFSGKKLWEIGAFKDIEASKTAFSELQEKGYVRYEDLPLETKDGRLIEVEFVSNSYMVNHHRVIQCNIRDISDRKNAEEKLIIAKNELEDTVRNRTAQLRALTIELTHAEHRERKRLAGILHDNLQQLLVSAKWTIQRAQKKESGNDGLQSLSRALDFLEEAITSSKSLVMELSPPVLHEAGLIAALKWLSRWMQEKYGFIVFIESKIEIPPEQEAICVLLFQSVRELLFNAMKHSQVKEAEIKAEKKDKNIRITVHDRGVGFNPAEITDNNDLKSGFGLFSIRERLDFMGGNMTIESARNLGTRVSMTVPVPEPAGDRKRVDKKIFIKKRKMDKFETAVKSGNNIRVLVADDHKIMREGLLGMLSSVPGIEIVGEADNGIDAVEMAKRLHPNIIIMDVNMPLLNGIKATKRIKSIMPDVNVIGLSMFGEEERAKSMLEAGASAYLQKTGPSNKLIEAIRLYSA